MFYYEYPEFEKKHLLKTEMLEQLRDYPRRYAKLLFQGYGNGIVNGCELSWDENQLTINSGIIYWNENLYFMETPYTLECYPEDRLRHLMVRFLNETKENGAICGKTNIYLTENPYDSDEMELCRFRLQEGSRLRSVYVDFQDHTTEFDTVNRIHTPFASLGGSTISPEILIQFAEEMMETEMLDPFDITLSMNILTNDGRVSRNAITQYLKIKNESSSVLDNNWNLYQELLKIIKNRKKRNSASEEYNQKGKRIMLM
ncbi:hypothetical protein [Lacrimispora brassicae]